MIRLLFVDDNAEDRGLAKLNLLQLSSELEMLETGSALEAIEMLKQNKVDCILSDFQMPDMNGLQFLKALRSKGIETPFIFLTGQGNEQIAAEALRSGAGDYFTKDVGFAHYDRLLNSIQKLVESTKLQENQRRADEKVRRLNLILQAIRQVGRLLTKEQNLDRILSGACGCLTETRDYLCAWIALLDEKENIVKFTRSGQPGKFAMFERSISAGKVPVGVRDALHQPGIVVIENPAETCSDFTLSSESEAVRALALRLEHAGNIYGLLCVLLPENLITYQEEKVLIREVAEDLALALHKNILEEQWRHAKEALRRREEQLSSIFRAAPVGIGLVYDGVFKHVNDYLCDMVGYSPEELLEKSERMLYPSDEEYEFVGKEKYAQIRERGTGSVETRFLRKDGEKIDVLLNSTPVDPDDLSASIIFIALDITSRKEVERQREQLIQADKMASLGILVSGVAHEINNPNHFITMNAPLLRDVWGEVQPILDGYYSEHSDFSIGGMPYEEVKKQVPVLFDGIEEGAGRIAQIVSDLRDFARLESGSIDESVDLNEVTKTALALLNNLILKTTDKLRVSYDEQIPQVRGNFRRLEQVLVNLIQNACQALPSREAGIFVETAYDKKKKRVIVSIKDKGVGIAEEDLPHIMDPFFTTKRESGGTGLGLAISASIVKEHGGNLEFDSQPGKGTTAKLILPA